MKDCVPRIYFHEGLEVLDPIEHCRISGRWDHAGFSLLTLKRESLSIGWPRSWESAVKNLQNIVERSLVIRHEHLKKQTDRYFYPEYDISL